MARPIKRGLDYFPFDVDFFSDSKIEYVKARFGEKGELIVVKLLCAIYQEGYYTLWNDDKALIFSTRAGKSVTPTLANDVVYELVKRGFFDKGIFDSFSLLTSKGIQRRYLKAAAERKSIELVPEYWLIDMPNKSKNDSGIVNPPINGVNPPINGVNRPINSQSKEKESIINILSSELHSDGAKKRGRVYDHDSRYYKAARWLADCIEGRIAGYKKHSEKILQSWANDYRLILEVDKRDPDMVRRLIRFSQEDSFWQCNILSMGKFRKQFDQLLAKYSAKKPVASAFSGIRDIRDIVEGDDDAE